MQKEIKLVHSHTALAAVWIAGFAIVFAVLWYRSGAGTLPPFSDTKGMVYPTVLPIIGLVIGAVSRIYGADRSQRPTDESVALPFHGLALMTSLLYVAFLMWVVATLKCGSDSGCSDARSVLDGLANNVAEVQGLVALLVTSAFVSKPKNVEPGRTPMTEEGGEG